MGTNMSDVKCQRKDFAKRGLSFKDYRVEEVSGTVSGSLLTR